MASGLGVGTRASLRFPAERVIAPATSNPATVRSFGAA